jgi:hypothetical protein
MDDAREELAFVMPLCKESILNAADALLETTVADSSEIDAETFDPESIETDALN